MELKAFSYQIYGHSLSGVRWSAASRKKAEMLDLFIRLLSQFLFVASSEPDPSLVYSLTHKI